MAFINLLLQMFPDIKFKLLAAKMSIKPRLYVKKNFSAAVLFAVMIAFAFLMIFLTFGISVLWVFFIFFFSLFFFFYLFMKKADISIRKRGRMIDRDVVFAGRFLLIKLKSGKPLINALIDASRATGAANMYFREIVHDIELGIPLEQALEDAMVYSASEKFRKILFHIVNSVKIGLDVTQRLEAVLDELTNEHLLEIKAYGKRLNSVTMFYMLLGVVFPSLGIAITVIIAAFTRINFGFSFFLVITFLLIILQYFFLTVFKSIRPNVDI